MHNPEHHSQKTRLQLKTPRSTSAKQYPSDQLYRALYDAIATSALRPGQKLTEEVIGQAFGATRWTIRPVLRRLASDGVVKIFRNRGAFVARPAISEAREVFAARRILESGLLTQFKKLAKEEVVRLRKHLRDEDRARREKDNRGQIQLAGAFHMLLADIAGNRLLSGMLKDLITQNALAVTVYQRSSDTTCRTDDHRTLVELLKQGKASAAARLMVKHLNEIENSLVFEASGDDVPELSVTLNSIRKRNESNRSRSEQFGLSC